MLVTVVGVGPQVNKFEQVSSDDHQMSVAGVRSPGLMFAGGNNSMIYRDRNLTVQHKNCYSTGTVNSKSFVGKGFASN